MAAQESSPPDPGRGLELVETVPDLSDHARYALVLGNGKYRAPLPTLDNPRRDVDLVVRTLSSLDFEVSREDITDLTYAEMKKRLDSFTRQLPRDAVVLFYFAGHGVQIDGTNYLLASHTDYKDENAIKSSALSEQDVLHALAGPDRLVILLLDACRNNPFRSAQSESVVTRATARGPAKRDASEVRARGAVIGYSTASGDTAGDGPPGGNSPYAAALGEVLPRPRRKIEDTFKGLRFEVGKATGERQEPWYSSSIEGDFYFQPKEPIDDREIARRRELERQREAAREGLRKRLMPWVWGLGGTGVAALIGGGVAGGLAVKSNNSAQDACPEPEQSVVGCKSSAVSESERALRLANASNVLLGVGGACVVSGLVLYLVLRRKLARELPPTPSVSVGAAKRSLQLSWRQAF